MKIITIFFVAVSLISCSSAVLDKSTVYKSSCILHVYPKVVLSFPADGKYHYRFAYLDEIVSGNYFIRKDTLLLSIPEKVRIGAFDDEIKRRNTDFSPEYDGYLIRKNRLYRINKSKEIEKTCYLVAER